MKQQQGSGLVGWVVLGLVVASFVVCGVVLRPERAFAIARGAACSTALDGFAEEPGEHRLPIIEVRVADPSAIGESSTNATAGHLVVDGVAYGARITFADTLRGMSKRALHIVLADPPQRFPFQELDLLNPATPDMLQQHMALWVAGEMGVPVAADVLVQVRINGKEAGVMELRERISSDVERVRGLSPVDAIIGPVVPAGSWSGSWPATSGAAGQRANTLATVLADTVITAYARRDSIAAIVDVDALLRMAAALDVLNTGSARCVWVFSSHKDLFQPVLCSSGLLDPAPPDTASALGNDVLLQRVLAEPEWRARRDRYAQEARERLVDDGYFVKQWTEEEHALMPSLLRDRAKHAAITADGCGSFSYGVCHAAQASAVVREAALQRWSSPNASERP